MEIGMTKKYDIIPEKIFNANIKNQRKPEIILGETVGFFDTVNKVYPELWNIYKLQKSLDWDEDEFPYDECVEQFKTVNKSVYDIMVKTLSWQWECDSIASRVFVNTLTNVCTSSEAWAGWQRISDNESIHAATYSEIVRNSFDNPDDIIDEMLAVTEAQERLITVGTIFEEARIASAQYALGQIPNDQELYDKIYLFIVAILAMERIQFMASFAITFAICDGTGLFQPIGKAVQKIAQDEFEVHVQYGKAVLKELYKTERGKTAFQNTLPKIIQLLDEVVQSEIDWTDYIFSEGRSLTGVTSDMIKDWVYFSATDVATFMGVEDKVSFKLVDENPLKYMEAWLDMSKVQASNQEEDTAQYKVNLLKRDDEGEVFDLDF